MNVGKVNKESPLEKIQFIICFRRHSRRRSCEQRPPLASLYHHQNQRCLISHQRVDGRHRGFGVYVNYPMAGTQIPCFIAKYLVTFFLRHVNLTRGTCSVRNSFGSCKPSDKTARRKVLSLDIAIFSTCRCECNVVIAASTKIIRIC